MVYLYAVDRARLRARSVHAGACGLRRRLGHIPRAGARHRPGHRRGARGGGALDGRGHGGGECRAHCGSTLEDDHVGHDWICFWSRRARRTEQSAGWRSLEVCGLAGAVDMMVSFVLCESHRLEVYIVACGTVHDQYL